MSNNLEHILNNIQKYMLLPENIIKLSNNNYIKNKKLSEEDNNVKATVPAKETEIKKTREIYIPIYKDQLFWCFYIIQNGYKKYFLINNDEFKVEKSYKIHIAEKLNEYKEDLKKCKLQRNNIETNLVNNNIITIEVLYALCIIFKLSIIYILNNTYYEFKYNDETPYIIILNNKNEIGLMDRSNDKSYKDYIDNIYNNYWKIENYKKPLKAISAYTVQNLIEICNKLKISLVDENNRKKTKKILYENILSKI